MAQQLINIGLEPNDKSGDLIRTAFNKVNQNFTELYTISSSSSISTADISGGNNAVVFTALSSVSSVKLFISVEGFIDGDITDVPYTQTCEATIAASYNRSSEPAMSVYGIVYTSPTQLATFTVRRGTGNIIEVVTTNTQTTKTIHVKIYSTDIVSYFD